MSIEEMGGLLLQIELVVGVVVGVIIVCLYSLPHFDAHTCPIFDWIFTYLNIYMYVNYYWTFIYLMGHLLMLYFIEKLFVSIDEY